MGGGGGGGGGMTSYVWLKIFDNNLVAIHKSKVALMYNKPAYIGICVFWNWVKYECTNSIIIALKINITTNQIYFAEIDSLMYEIKTKDRSSDK